MPIPICSWLGSFVYIYIIRYKQVTEPRQTKSPSQVEEAARRGCWTRRTLGWEQWARRSRAGLTHITKSSSMAETVLTSRTELRRNPSPFWETTVKIQGNITTSKYSMDIHTKLVLCCQNFQETRSTLTRIDKAQEK